MNQSPNPSSETSTTQQLIKLKQLLDSGALTQEEFVLMKQRVLGIDISTTNDTESKDTKKAEESHDSHSLPKSDDPVIEQSEAELPSEEDIDSILKIQPTTEHPDTSQVTTSTKKKSPTLYIIVTALILVLAVVLLFVFPRDKAEVVEPAIEPTVTQATPIFNTDDEIYQCFVKGEGNNQYVFYDLLREECVKKYICQNYSLDYYNSMVANSSRSENVIKVEEGHYYVYGCAYEYGNTRDMASIDINYRDGKKIITPCLRIDGYERAANVDDMDTSGWIYKEEEDKEYDRFGDLINSTPMKSIMSESYIVGKYEEGQKGGSAALFAGYNSVHGYCLAPYSMIGDKFVGPFLYSELVFKIKNNGETGTLIPTSNYDDKEFFNGHELSVIMSNIIIFGGVQGGVKLDFFLRGFIDDSRDYIFDLNEESVQKAYKHFPEAMYQFMGIDLYGTMSN